MQSAPIRLQQAIRSAFRAAKPLRQSITHPAASQPLAPQAQSCSPPPSLRRYSHQHLRSYLAHVRFYSDDKRSDVEKKVEDAKQRIGDSLDSRAENVINLPSPSQDPLKSREDETIIHTLPESSSIVYNSDGPGETATSAAEVSTKRPQAASSTSNTRLTSKPRPRETDSSSTKQSNPSSSEVLPSQLNARYSNARSRFNDFMDNFQTHVFTASRRLNDLTGYSSIEQLKRDIEAQENAVRAARQHVKSSRDAYQDAIATRSDTQREVNDLLHRKHAWTPTDLERFTSLYRSDHANEQAEQAAHQTLSQSEQTYEEASTRLSKSILARYHEEQVWSDKIRQMSTWGTWGLMGLNVLLFVVFQILIEPWRRRRLVRGFEEKVTEALKEQSAENELRTIFHIQSAQQENERGAASVGGLVARLVGMEAEDTGRKLAEPAQVASTDTLATAVPVQAGNTAATDPSPTISEMAERTQIEQTIETATAAEILSEGPAQQSSLTSTLDPASSSSPSRSQLVSPPGTDTSTPPPPPPTTLTTPPPISATPYKDLPFVLGTHVRIHLDRATTHIQSLFDEKATLATTRRELTAKALEGAFFGAMGAVTLFWLVGVGTVRGR